MRSENDVKYEHEKKSNAINFDILIPSSACSRGKTLCKDDCSYRWEKN